MPYVKSADREQLFMTSLDMLVDRDSVARIIDAFVDSLDLKEMGFTNTSPSAEGRPAYPPEALLKLYIYGHRKNIRSSRKLQRECHINIELKWLVKGAEPDFRTISDFRKDNHHLLKKVFLEFNERFSDLMTGYVSVDGSKFFASNSKDKNFTSSKLDDRIRWLSGHIDEYLRQMDQQDKSEGGGPAGTLTAEELQAKLTETEERLKEYQGYQEYMQKNNLSQLSLTDPDARLMKNRNGFTVSHNVQAAVDSETHMIADFDITSNPTDYGQLGSTLHGMKERTPDKILESVADKGYQSEEDMARCLENGIIPNVIPPDGEDTFEINIPFEGSEDLHPESTAAADLYRCLHAGVIPDAYKTAITKAELKEKEVIVQQDPAEIPRSPFNDEDEMIAKAAEGYFVRDPEQNIVYCPMGETLRQNTVTKKDRIRYINKNACRHCPCRNQCHGSRKGYREVDFRKDEFVKPNGIWIKANGGKPKFHKRSIKREKRLMVVLTLRPDRQKMAARMCISEHPFGTIKRSMDSSYFLLRKNAKVTGEFALFSLAYNLRRAVTILGFEEVMKRVTRNTDLYFICLYPDSKNCRKNKLTDQDGQIYAAIAA